MKTEITVQVFNTLEEIKTILKNKGFIKKEEFILDDYYYTNYSLQEIKKLAYKDLIKNSFLLRNIKKEESSKTEICYKNKVFNENNEVVLEEKIKTSISDFNIAIKVFSLANINNWINLKQKCLVYQNDDICFCLQIVDNLGIFIEYEDDETMAGLSLIDKRNLMINNLNKIGFTLNNDYNCKKVYLLLKRHQ